MAHRFIIYTDKGKFHSLKSPVQILFTLTPVESKQRTVSYDPLAWRIRRFDSNVDKREEIQWESKFAFIAYEPKDAVEGPLCLMTGNCRSLSPGHPRTISDRPGTQELQWGGAESFNDTYNFGQPCISLLNKTGKSQNIAVEVRDSNSRYRGIAAYYPLENDERIVTPSNMIMRVYAVDPLVNYKKRFLLPKDLAHPLLQISTSRLPETSTWKLFEARGGTVQLINNDVPRLDVHEPGIPLPIQTLVAPLAGVNDRIDAMFKSLVDTQQRLNVVEESVKSAQGGLASGEQAVADIRSTVEEMKKSGSNIPQTTVGAAAHDRGQPTNSTLGPDPRITLLEEKALQLARSFDQTRQFLIAVQNFVKDARPQLSELKTTVPTIEMKTNRLDESVGQAQQDARDSLAETRSGLTGLGARVAAVEAKVGEVPSRLEWDSGGEGVLFPPAGDAPGTFGNQRTKPEPELPSASDDPLSFDFSRDL